MLIRLALDKIVVRGTFRSITLVRICKTFGCECHKAIVMEEHCLQRLAQTLAFWALSYHFRIFGSAAPNFALRRTCRLWCGPLQLHAQHSRAIMHSSSRNGEVQLLHCLDSDLEWVPAPHAVIWGGTYFSSDKRLVENMPSHGDLGKVLFIGTVVMKASPFWPSWRLPLNPATLPLFGHSIYHWQIRWVSWNFALEGSFGPMLGAPDMATIQEVHMGRPYCRWPPGEEPEWTAHRNRFPPPECTKEVSSVPLTKDDLLRAMKRLANRTAGGSDGWRVQELKTMPPCFLTPLAHIYTRIEHGAPWPVAAQQILVSLLSKKGKPSPLNMRPISVTPLLYRFWGSARWADMVSHQETWILPEQKGFRPKSGPVEASVGASLFAEEGHAQGLLQMAVDLDLQKGL